jgi:hypothetical protein
MVRTRPAYVKPLQIGLLVFGIGAGAVLARSNHELSLFIGAFFIIGGLAMGLVEPRPRRGALRVADAGIFLGDELLVPRDRIPDRPACELVDRRRLFLDSHMGRIDIDLVDGGGASLMQALRFHLHAVPRFAGFQTRRPVGVASGAVATVVMLALIVHGLVHGLKLVGTPMPGPIIVMLGLFLILPLALPLAFFERLLRLTTLEVGADGIMLRILGRRRWIPHRDVTQIAQSARGVILDVRTGSPVRFEIGRPYAEGSTDRETALQRATTLFELLHMHRTEAACAADGAESILSRRGRPIREWREALSRHGLYRTIVVSEERLWQIVGHGGHSADMRAGAALALRPSLDESGRRRLHYLADACAAPNLRGALRAVASSDDAAVDTELESLASP